MFVDPTDEITRFKKDFDTIGKILLTGATLSLTEGLSNIKTNLYNIEESVKNVENKGKMHSFRAV